MPRVLVPVDGSDHSMRVARHVVRLKDELRDKLEIMLLNVQPPVPTKELLLDGTPAALRHLEKQLKARGARQLEAARAALEGAGIECRPHVEIGTPAEVIARFAATYHCEMIIMGTRGLGAITALLLGSVATKVVHLSSVPVVLVP